VSTDTKNIKHRYLESGGQQKCANGKTLLCKVATKSHRPQHSTASRSRGRRSRKPYATGHDPLEYADDDNPLRNILFTDKAYFMFAVMCNCRKWAGQKPHSILNS